MAAFNRLFRLQTFRALLRHLYILLRTRAHVLNRRCGLLVSGTSCIAVPRSQEHRLLTLGSWMACFGIGCMRHLHWVMVYGHRPTLCWQPWGRSNWICIFSGSYLVPCVELKFLWSLRGLLALVREIHIFYQNDGCSVVNSHHAFVWWL